MLIYIIYFIVLAVLATEFELHPFKHWPALVFIIFCLALLAGLRGNYISKDYDTYNYSFNAVYIYLNQIKLGNIFTFFEPGYIVTVAAIRSFSDLNYGIYILLFFAFASITLKIYSINKLSLNPFLAILFYFTHYFGLQEMTQIRIGFASALFFMGLIHFFRGNRAAFVLYIIIATTFHYSAILYLIVLFFNATSLNRYLYTGIIILSVVLGFIKTPLFDILSSINPDLIAGKLQGYDYIQRHSTDLKINIFNVLYFINIACILYIIFAIPVERLMTDSKLIFFTKCSILSVFLLSLFSGVPLVAFRISELFGILSLFMFAGIVKYLPFGKLNIVIPIVIAGLFFYINYFHNQLLGPYHIANFR
jgi:hypothetical protein